MASPFTAAGATTGAILIEERYSKPFINTVYRNGFLDLWPKKTWPGGTRYNFAVRTASNSSVQVFTEGLVQPSPDSQDYAHIAIAWTYVRAMCQITGHAIDAMQGGNYAGVDVVDSELAGAAEDVSQLLCTSFIGSSYGLDLAVDETSAYGGQARGAATWWESKETSLGSQILSTGDVLTILETLRDNSIGANTTLILCPENQATNLYGLAGPHTIYNGDPSDKAPGRFRQSFANIPIVSVGQMDDNTIYFLDTNMQQGRPGFMVPVIRTMQAKTMSPSADSDVYQISTGAAFVVHAPKLQGKLTNVAT